MILGLMTLSPRLRQGVQSLALALLMAGITTAAVKVFGWKIWHRPPSASQVRGRPRVLNLRDDQRLVAVSAEPRADRRSAVRKSVRRGDSPSSFGQ